MPAFSWTKDSCESWLVTSYKEVGFPALLERRWHYWNDENFFPLLFTGLFIHLFLWLLTPKMDRFRNMTLDMICTRYNGNELILVRDLMAAGLLSPVAPKCHGDMVLTSSKPFFAPSWGHNLCYSIARSFVVFLLYWPSEVLQKPFFMLIMNFTVYQFTISVSWF